MKEDKSIEKYRRKSPELIISSGLFYVYELDVNSIGSRYIDLIRN